MPARYDIVERLRELDCDIPDAPSTRVLGLSLHRHWKKEFLTALWYPHIYNKFKVPEIFLRYGKSRAEMDNLERELGLERLEGDSADFGSFPAHVHLSMGLANCGFFYQVVIGPRAWPDYDHMVRVLQDQTIGPRLLDAFRVLHENG